MHPPCSQGRGAKKTRHLKEVNQRRTYATVRINLLKITKYFLMCPLCFQGRGAKKTRHLKEVNQRRTYATVRLDLLKITKYFLMHPLCFQVRGAKISRHFRGDERSCTTQYSEYRLSLKYHRNYRCIAPKNKKKADLRTYYHPSASSNKLKKLVFYLASSYIHRRSLPHPFSVFVFAHIIK